MHECVRIKEKCEAITVSWKKNMPQNTGNGVAQFYFLQKRMYLESESLLKLHAPYICTIAIF